MNLPSIQFKNHICQLRIASLLGLMFIQSAAAFETNLPAPIKVSPHVYAWIGPHGGPSKENQGFRMNMGMVIGQQSIAIIESGYTKAMARDMIKHAATLSDKPVRYVINTNSRPDRYFGNDVFKAHGADIYAHKKEIDYMKEMVSMHIMGAEMSLEVKEGQIKPPALPNKAIDKKTTIDLGGVNIILSPVPVAHTPSPLVVHIPKDNVVYAGDSLYSERMLAIIPGGDAKQWIDNYLYLDKTFPTATFIPGHGKPAKIHTGFKKSTYDYLIHLDKHMTAAVDEGIDLQDALKTLDQSEWQYLENYDLLAGRNAQQVYIEREAAAFD